MPSFNAPPMRLGEVIVKDVEEVNSESDGHLVARQQHVAGPGCALMVVCGCW
jgi:hypothetical protein